MIALKPRRARKSTKPALQARVDGHARQPHVAAEPSAKISRPVEETNVEARQQRLRRLLDLEISFIPHPSFDDPNQASRIVESMPEPSDKSARRIKPPKGLPPYLASLYDDTLLTRDQEQHLFRKMNFLKYQAARLRDQLDPDLATQDDLDAIERRLEEANQIKNQIIRANLRLVVSIAKRRVGPSHNFFELVSDGNMSLMRAVEKFDFSRGNKFSTYASWAVMNNFARSIPGEAHWRSRFLTGHDEMFESARDVRSDEFEAEGNQRQMRETVQGMLERLDERERRIITSRFGLDGAMELTLEQLGRELGITKERVRQLESRAQDKLRKFASERRIDPLLI
jgi:RNA polymerase primary sigma factor